MDKLGLLYGIIAIFEAECRGLESSKRECRG